MKKHLRGMLSVSSVGLLTSFAGVGSAQERIGADVTPGSAVSIFGNQGQIAISSEAGAAFTHTTVSGVDGSTTNFVFRPGVDYFLIKRLSLGAFFGVDRESVPTGSSTTIGVGPRVGYSIPFSDRFSIWPKVGFSYNSTSIKTDAIGGLPESDTSNNAIALNLFAPIMFHHYHYFAGIGPALDTDLSGDAKATTFAVRVTLGGWIF
jgi:hypothetical protein